MIKEKIQSRGDYKYRENTIKHRTRREMKKQIYEMHRKAVHPDKKYCDYCQGYANEEAKDE